MRKRESPNTKTGHTNGLDGLAYIWHGVLPSSPSLSCLAFAIHKSNESPSHPICTRLRLTIFSVQHIRFHLSVRKQWENIQTQDTTLPQVHGEKELEPHKGKLHDTA